MLGTSSPLVLLPEWSCSGLQWGTHYLLDRGLLGDIVNHADHVSLQERSGRVGERGSLWCTHRSREAV